MGVYSRSLYTQVDTSFTSRMTVCGYVEQWYSTIVSLGWLVIPHRDPSCTVCTMYRFPILVISGLGVPLR
jgi:hypothetical protein